MIAIFQFEADFPARIKFGPDHTGRSRSLTAFEKFAVLESKNGIGPHHRCKETSAHRRSHSIRLGVGFVSTAGNLWKSYHRRWRWRVGWSWTATSVRICYNRSEEISTSQMYVLCPHSRYSGLRITGMNLLSGTTWKGAKLRIGEAKPDFRERYAASHPHGPLPTGTPMPPTGSNARMRHLRTTGNLKSAVWEGASKAFTLQICPS